jgi:predicted MFS family arabinose efflux permease
LAVSVPGLRWGGSSVTSLYAYRVLLWIIADKLQGGVVAEYLSWKWVFWIFGMVSAMSTLASFFVIPPPPPQSSPTMRNTVDWIGGTLITVGLVMLLFALSEGNVVGWRTPWVPTLIAVSLLIILGFGIWQHHLETRTQKRPLIKLSIFSNRKFAWANVLMGLFFSAFNNYLILATYWFQDFQGRSVIQTTLRFVPNGVTGIVVATVTGFLVSHVRGDYILMFSTCAVSMSSLLFAIPIPETTTYWAYGFPAMVFCVCGADTIFPVLTLFVAKTLPPEDASLGGALITAVGQIGRAVGLALATAVQTAIIAKEMGVSVDQVGEEGHELQPWDPALKAGIRGTAWFNFGMSIISLLIVLVFIRGIGIVGGKR